MRVGRTRSIRWNVVPLLAAVASAVLATPAAAQRATFLPELFLDTGYSSNVRYGGGTAEGERNADWSTRLGLVLPLRRETGASSWTLSYAPSFERFSRLREYDADAHRVAFEGRVRPGRSSSVEFGLRYERSQEQGSLSGAGGLGQVDAPGAGLPDAVLVDRAERDSYVAELQLRQSPTSRWEIGEAVQASVSRYRATDVPGALPPESKDEYGGTLSLRYLVGRRSTIGTEYGYRRVEPERSNREDAYLVGLLWEFRSGRIFTTRLRGGGFWRSVGDTAEVPASTLQDRRGFQAALEFAWALPTVQISVQAARAPTGGGSTAGTSTDTSLLFGLSGEPDPRLRWQFGARYARRRPTQPSDPTFNAYGAGGSLDILLVRNLGLRLTADWAEQSGLEDGGNTSVEPSFVTARVGIVWYPAGAPRRGR